MRPRPLVVVSAGGFVASLNTGLVAVAVPIIARDLHVSSADVSWVLSAYLLTVSCLLTLAGRAADLLGRKRVYLAGSALFVAGSVLCAIAPTLELLIAARVLQGIGAAMTMAIAPAMVTHSVPPEMRARGLGIQLGTTYAGLTLGPAVGGLLTAVGGWSSVFGVIAGAGVVTTSLAAVLLAADHPTTPTKKHLDVLGALLFAASLASALLALKRASSTQWMDHVVLSLIAVAIVLGILLVRHENAIAEPLLPLGLFRRKAFALGIVGGVLLYTVSFMASYLLPFELQEAGGLGPAAIGAYMTAQPVLMAFVAPVSGVIADRWGPRIPSAAGMIAIGLGLAWLTSSVRSLGAPLVFSLALMGVGAGLYVSANSALIMATAPRERQGTASAMVATARTVGMTLGTAVAASLHRAVGFYGGVVVAGCLALLGALLAIARPTQA